MISDKDWKGSTWENVLIFQSMMSYLSVLDFVSLPVVYRARFPSLAGWCWRAQACQAGRILEEWREFYWSWRGGYNQSSKQDWKQSVKPDRKRGRGTGKSQKWERAEASIYSEVESKIQTSGKPERKQRLVGYKWEDNITRKCFTVFNIILEIRGISVYRWALNFSSLRWGRQ